MPVWASALAATLVAQVVSAFAGMTVPLLGPPLMQGMGLAPESIGLVSAMTAAGICWYLACGGPMLGHFGAIRSLQIGLLCIALGLAVLSQPVGLPGLLGAVAIGFGIAPNTPAGSRILTRTAPARHRTLIFSVKQAGVPLGGMLAGLLIAPLAAARGVPAALGAVIGVVLLAILAVRLLARRLEGEAGEARPGWGRALLSVAVLRRAVGSLRAHPSLPLLTALGTSFSVVQACLGGFVATYAITRHGATLAQAGGLVAVMQGASLIGRIGLGWVSDRIAGRAMALLVVLALAASAAVLLLVGAGGGWGLYGCAAAAGLTAFGWNGIHMAELARVAPPALVGEVTSAANLFGFLGSIGGPLGFSLAVSLSDSYALAFGLAAGQLAVFGLAALVLSRRAPAR